MQKIKQFIESEKGKDIMTVLIVILVGIVSFELGRLSKETNFPGIKILQTQEEYSNQIENDNDTVPITTNAKTSQIIQEYNFPGKTFFASNKGSKYYSLGCSAGKTIKRENRIYFATGEEAQMAGYTLSSSCN